MICPLKKRIEEKKAFQLARVFPGKGTPAVKVGQSVVGTDVIAHCEISAGQRLIKIAHVLGVAGGEVGKYLTRKIGDRIYQGEVIARKRAFFGLGKTEIKAPADGVIADIDSRGDVILRFLPSRVRLVAAANGEVTEIGKDRIIIKTIVTQVRGFASQGTDREGTIQVIGGPKDFLLPASINAEAAGKILVGGALLERSALEKAVTIGVKGLVAGGMHYRDFEALGKGGDFGISLLITEGFGISPMGEDIWNFFKKAEGRSAFILGRDGQVILPDIEETEESGKAADVSWRPLQLGDKVRLFQGEGGELLGEVKELLGEQILNSGILTEVAKVSLRNGEEAILPAANLEIIE